MAGQPKKKPSAVIAIGIGKPKDDLDSPEPVDQEKGGGPSSDDEPDPQDPNEEQEGGLECEPDPEAVCYRSVHETCQFCKYMQGNNCAHPMVAQPVQPGDSCKAFKDKGGDMEQGAPPDMTQAGYDDNSGGDQS